MPGRASRLSSTDRRRAALLWVVLLVFCLAQAIAFAHATRHVGSDAGGLPADHAQLCTDCASALPLLAVAGGLGAALALASPVSACMPSMGDRRPVDAGFRGAFRSRAPPR